MSESRNRPKIPMQLDAQGNLEILSVMAFETHLIEGSLMLALRCADSDEAIAAGGNRTVQLALSLPQVEGLLDALRTGRQVLENAVTPGGVVH